MKRLWLLMCLCTCVLTVPLSGFGNEYDAFSASRLLGRRYDLETHAAYEQRQKTRAEVLDKFGRTPYPELKAELLAQIAAADSDGVTLAAIDIFKAARDSEALELAIRSIKPRKRDSRFWNEISSVLSWWVPYTAEIAFVEVMPIEHSYTGGLRGIPPEWETTHRERLKAIYKKISYANSSYYANYIEMLDSPSAAIKETLDSFKTTTDPVAKSNYFGQLYYLTHYDSNYYQAERDMIFAALDPNNDSERGYYTDFACAIKRYQEAADVLVADIDKPITYEEMNRVASECSRWLTPKEAHDMALEARRSRLIKVLLKANRAKEAQDFAERFYGKDADPTKISRMSWNLMGAMQDLSGKRTFENKIKSAEPTAGTLEYHINRYNYYKGRKENDSAIATLNTALELGLKYDSSVWVEEVYEKFISHYGWRSAQAYPYYLALYSYAIGKGDSWKRHRAAIGLLQYLHNSADYRTDNDTAKKIIDLTRKEMLENGDTLMFGSHFWPENKLRVISHDDPVFAVLCDPKRSRDFMCGYFYKIYFSLEDKTVELLQDVTEKIRRHGAPLGEKSIANSLCDHFLHPKYSLPNIRDAALPQKRAIIAQYILEHFPTSEIEKNRLSKITLHALKVYYYPEGRKCLDALWDARVLSIENRIEGLRMLRMKVAPGTQEIADIDAELAKFNIIP